MKTFKVKPAERFALEFEDGKTIEMVFNAKALSIMGELINNKKVDINGPTFYSAIIYAGAKACDEDFSEDEADALYIQLNEAQPEALNGILTEYCHASGLNDEDLKKNAIRLMQLSKKKK